MRSMSRHVSNAKRFRTALFRISSLDGSSSLNLSPRLVIDPDDHFTREPSKASPRYISTVASPPAGAMRRWRRVMMRDPRIARFRRFPCHLWRLLFLGGVLGGDVLECNAQNRSVCS